MSCEQDAIDFLTSAESLPGNSRVLIILEAEGKLRSYNKAAFKKSFTQSLKRGMSYHVALCVVNDKGFPEKVFDPNLINSEGMPFADYMQFAIAAPGYDDSPVLYGTIDLTTFVQLMNNGEFLPVNLKEKHLVYV